MIALPRPGDLVERHVVADELSRMLLVLPLVREAGGSARLGRAVGEVYVVLTAGPGWLGWGLCNRICKQHLRSYS